MDFQEDSLFGSSGIILPEGMDMEANAFFGNKINLPLLEDDMFDVKIGTYGATSTLCLSDNESEQKELPTFTGNKFHEEQFFAEPVLTLNGGPGLNLVNDYNRDTTEGNKNVMKYLKPDMDALSSVHDFVEFEVNPNSLASPFKPIEETDRLVKLKDVEKPFYYSRRDVIAQKPLDMVRKTGRMTFEIAELSFIEKKSKLKIFLRDRATTNSTILKLHGTKIEKNHKCSCFDEHSNSLFCLRSRYDKSVQITWSEDKSYVFINVDDDDKFELLFAPLIPQSKLKNPNSIIMQLVFQMETELEILEQSFFIKFLTFPKRDIDNFIKTLVKENYVENSYLEEIADSSVSGTSELLKIEIDAKYEEEFKLFLQSIGAEIGFQ